LLPWKNKIHAQTKSPIKHIPECSGEMMDGGQDVSECAEKLLRKARGNFRQRERNANQ